MDRRIPPLVIVAIMFVAGALLYGQLPERIASHWDAQGNVNGYMDKFWGVFLLPVISLVVTGLMLWLPKLDPLRKPTEHVFSIYANIVLITMIFLAYVYALVLAWGLGYVFQFTVAIVPAFAAMFFYLGMQLGKLKQNWFFGIRTPWTMSSEKVWGKTHALAEKLFKTSGIICLAGLLVPTEAFWFILAPAIASAVALFVYSYFEYRKENGHGKTKR